MYFWVYVGVYIGIYAIFFIFYFTFCRVLGLLGVGLEENKIRGVFCNGKVVIYKGREKFGNVSRKGFRD